MAMPDPSTSNGLPVASLAPGPFAHPSGRLGRLAGLIMFWSNSQDGLIDILDVQPGDDVLEVGYGPGRLVRLLAARTGAASIRGVDPSPEMRNQATRHNRKAVRAGRVRLDIGTADHTGLPDADVDRVVSVRTVAIWPDLQAGMAELHRILRPGGTVVIAWHGGTAPNRIVRKLSLPQDRLEHIERIMRARFGQVTRDRLRNLEVFKAVRAR